MKEHEWKMPERIEWAMPYIDPRDRALVEAAPALLAACEAALGTGALEHGGVADVLRAAIAKARGES